MHDPSKDTKTLELEPGSRLTAAGYVLEVVEGGSGTHVGRERLRVGAALNNDVVLTVPDASRYHFEITLDEAGARIVDLGSTNGTRVDGVRVVEAYLNHGSVIDAGTGRLRFFWRGQRRIVPVATATSFEGLIGQSLSMRRTFATLAQAAASDSTVMLRGETGTGKEESARAIHVRSRRGEKPFVVVDLAALAPTLAESELFGHERGAFTGAERRHVGAFERADGGTIFLDELGEVPLSVQPKLLRALESRRVQRVGGNEAIRFDARIVAGTHRDLRAEVNAGRFREDLYYRLAVIEIAIPPLRERIEDIPMLAQHFLQKHSSLEGKRLGLSSEALQWIVQQQYPGNVRELENVVERAVALAMEPYVVRADVMGGMMIEQGADPAKELLPLPPEGIDLDGHLGEIERNLLLQALERTGGNRTNAAKLLHTSFRSLRYRLAKYGLSEDIVTLPGEDPDGS
jgi:two-component system response regulator GlrR